jgi:hypothetical protein
VGNGFEHAQENGRLGFASFDTGLQTCHGSLLEHKYTPLGEFDCNLESRSFFREKTNEDADGRRRPPTFCRSPSAFVSVRFFLAND